MTAAALLTASLAMLAPVASQPESAHTDLRTVELLVYECATEIARRDVTLFANGTVRHRQHDDSERRMHLAELDGERLRGFLRRLAKEDLSEAESTRYGAAGDWVEQCSLRLALPERPSYAFRFARFDSLELHLDRVVKIAEELALLAVAEDTETGLPHDYEPRPGDVLVRADGAHFEVIGRTGDGEGIELRGIDEPLTVYLPVAALAGEFVELERRATPLVPQ